MFNYDVHISHHESTESGFFEPIRTLSRTASTKKLQIHTQRNIMHETFILQRFMCINALIFQYLQRSGKNETLINRKRLDSSIYLYNTNKYGLYLPVWRTSFST